MCRTFPLCSPWISIFFFPGENIFTLIPPMSWLRLREKMKTMIEAGWKASSFKASKIRSNKLWDLPHYRWFSHQNLHFQWRFPIARLGLITKGYPSDSSAEWWTTLLLDTLPKLNCLIPILVRIFFKVQYGGFLKCGYPHSWLVYNGKSYQNGWFAGTTTFGNTHVLQDDYTSLDEFGIEVPIPVLSPGWSNSKVHSKDFGNHRKS